NTAVVAARYGVGRVFDVVPLAQFTGPLSWTNLTSGVRRLSIAGKEGHFFKSVFELAIIALFISEPFKGFHKRKERLDLWSIWRPIKIGIKKWPPLLIGHPCGECNTIVPRIVIAGYCIVFLIERWYSRMSFNVFWSR